MTLRMAQILKERLLAEGYDVLMLRDGEDVQLDNIARTVLANNYADCHISLHWDSTSSDKGCFFYECSPPMRDTAPWSRWLLTGSSTTVWARLW